ncbi:fasciclin-like arabinogalactan protein 12 [Diospyros lotus]|uniref:fasciclin-like arabinogalactan protein 12 n=1 Tax=Diospyros lotus TaxID=55363 RepID=UPI0022569656|nr:fasciclin-like arabinogalactan protein 12 [Diospyros lotus]
MANNLLSPLPLLLIFFLHSPTVSAQPPAAAPAPPGPPNITAILEKAGHFSKLIRLLKHTQMDDRIYKELNNTEEGLTVFAPNDKAFTDVEKRRLIKSFSELQRIQLLQYHVVPTLIPFSEFQTLGNPVNTEAGSNTDDQFPLNVTTSEDQVNVTTGVVNTTVSSTVYIDDKLAVYEVDKVLLPLHFFPATSAPAPAPANPEKKALPQPEISAAMAVTRREPELERVMLFALQFLFFQYFL